MITLIEALHFRCLRYVRQPLDPFHVLVGPNASGKTTFLDVVAFLGRLVSAGPEAAVEERTKNFQDLTWGRAKDHFELAVEANIPDAKRAVLGGDGAFDRVRYEVSCGVDEKTQELGILRENVLFLRPHDELPRQPAVFPRMQDQPPTLMSKNTRKEQVIRRSPGRSVRFASELGGRNPLSLHSLLLGSRKSAIANIPADEKKFPVSTWLHDLLTRVVQSIVLNSLRIRSASPPNQGRGFRSDGSNLPWVMADLQKRDPTRFDQWIAHLRTALPDLDTIRVVEREDDRHKYLTGVAPVMAFSAEFQCPGCRSSWTSKLGHDISPPLGALTEAYGAIRIFMRRRRGPPWAPQRARGTRLGPHLRRSNRAQA